MHFVPKPPHKKGLTENVSFKSTNPSLSEILSDIVMESAFCITSPPLLLAGTNRDSLTATGLIPIIDSEMESIKEFENNSLLTQSQQTRLQLYLGNFSELKECLDKLIVINVENPVQLQRLFNLWEKIVNAIALLSQYSQNECTKTTESSKTQEDKKEETENINYLVEEVKESELDDKLENMSIHNSQMLRVSQINDIFLPNFEEEEFDLQEDKEEFKIEPEIEIKPLPEECDCPICGDIIPGEEMFTFAACGHNYCKEVIFYSHFRNLVSILFY